MHKLLVMDILVEMNLTLLGKSLKIYHMNKNDNVLYLNLYNLNLYTLITNGS